jgi:hypothetical protein
VRGKQDSYHYQLESFHKQSKICLCIYIFILAPKFIKQIPAQRVGSSFLHAFYILEIIYIEREGFFVELKMFRLLIILILEISYKEE